MPANSSWNALSIAPGGAHNQADDNIPIGAFTAVSRNFQNRPIQVVIQLPGAGFTTPLRLTKARLSEFSWLVHTTNALASRVVQL